MSTNLSAANDGSESRSSLKFTFAAIIALAFALMLWGHANALWRISYYQFFPFVILGSGFLARTRWDDVMALVPGNAGLSTLGFLASWCLLMASELIVSPAVAYVGALVFLAAAVYRLGGTPLARAMAPAWALLWILVPLPLGMGLSFLLLLQNIATRWSSFVLDWLHVYHFRDGNVIQIAGHRLLIEEACTGANSLFSVVACCLFLIFWSKQRWYRALVLLVACIFWVLVTNAIRIIVIAYAFDRFSVDLGSGLRHSLLGFACFALAIILIWSTDRLLQFFFPRWGNSIPTPVRTTPPPTLTLAAIANLCPRPLAAAFALPLAFHLLLPILDVAPNTPAFPPIPTMANVGEGTLKKLDVAGWKFVAYNTQTRIEGATWGDYSKVWTFQRGGLTAAVSVDYPFSSFHDLWLCYQATGWTDEFRDARFAQDFESAPDFWFEFTCRKVGLHSTYVAFCETNAQGDVLKNQGRWADTFGRLENSLKFWGDKLAGRVPAPIIPRSPVYQFQVSVESHGPITLADRNAVRALFVASTNRLRGELFPKAN